MELVLLIAAAAAFVWWAICAEHVDPWIMLAAFAAGGYVLGPPLWSPQLGPVPLTADRVLLAGLAAATAWRLRQGRLTCGKIIGADWLVLLALAYFTLRCAATPAPPLDGSSVKPWWRLIVAFWTPTALYLVARTAPGNQRAWRGALWMLTALGAVLAVTACAEITRQWWAVFPRYIADPQLGTHFGRARGPALNSASLGIWLTICFWAAWMLWPRLPRLAKLAMIVLLALMAIGVYFTYTRSTWIGLAASLAIIPLLQLPRSWRNAAAAGVVVCAGVVVVAFGSRIADLGRKDSDGSAEHSVYQRASFLYVSTRMFKEAPVFGCGFGRFYDLKMPYLADRSQQLELESLRQLDHHNTLLSVLVETGLVGGALFMALLAAFGRMAWRLFRASDRPAWQRRQGLFTLATLIAYLASALFHDLTLLATEHWLLFISAGMSASLLAAHRGASVAARKPIASMQPTLALG